jgi:hypothetical protein
MTMWNLLVKWSAYLLGLISLPIVGFLILVGIVIAAAHQHLSAKQQAARGEE